MVVILGGYFPDGNCPSGSYPGWVFSYVGIFPGENHPGGNFPGGSFHVTQFLIFNQVTSLLNIFGRLVSHFIFKHPKKSNSNVEINRFSN